VLVAEVGRVLADVVVGMVAVVVLLLLVVVVVVMAW
jgi:hypothetical protein